MLLRKAREKIHALPRFVHQGQQLFQVVRASRLQTRGGIRVPQGVHVRLQGWHGPCPVRHVPPQHQRARIVATAQNKGVDVVRLFLRRDVREIRVPVAATTATKCPRQLQVRACTEHRTIARPSRFVLNILNTLDAIQRTVAARAVHKTPGKVHSALLPCPFVLRRTILLQSSPNKTVQK